MKMLAMFDQVIIRYDGEKYWATLETIKQPNNRHAVLLASNLQPTAEKALIELLTMEVKRCPDCENRMEYANRQTRDGILFLPKCPICGKVIGPEEYEGVMA
jgi:NAD-dependent SIR2 family protein deacetylase